MSHPANYKTFKIFIICRDGLECVRENPSYGSSEKSLEKATYVCMGIYMTINYLSIILSSSLVPSYSKPRKSDKHVTLFNFYIYFWFFKT